MSDRQLGFVENFVISGSAAVISKTVAAPIERIKLLMQNQDEIIKQGKLDRPYGGIFECASRTFRSEGTLSFWRGNLANCLRYFPTQALNFAFKDRIKILFHVPENGPQWHKFVTNILSGGTAGTISLVFVHSLDFVRTKLANDAIGVNGSRQYKGVMDVYGQTLRTDGIRGLYRGFVISAICIFVYRGLYFGLYDSIKPILLSPASSFMAYFALGYAVTIIASTVGYPMDTVRRRMMMTSGTGRHYRNWIDCCMQMSSKEGYYSFYKGFGANVLRGIAGAGALSGFDFIKKHYRT